MEDSKQNTSQQGGLAAEAASCTPGCGAGAQPADQGILLLSACRITSRALYSILGSSQDVKKVELVLQKAVKMVKELEHLLYEKRLKEWGLFSLAKTRLWRYLTAAFQ